MFGRPRSQEVAIKTQTTPIVAKATPTIAPSPTIKPIITPETEPETFVAVKGAENEKLQAEMAPDMVAVSQRAMVLEKLMGQPKWAVNYIELTFGILILIALILTVFIKIKIQHPKLIANGAMLLTIIAITIVVNQFLSLYESQIL